jgi:hypothetical protein
MTWNHAVENTVCRRWISSNNDESGRLHLGLIPSEVIRGGGEPCFVKQEVLSKRAKGELVDRCGDSCVEEM